MALIMSMIKIKIMPNSGVILHVKSYGIIYEFKDYLISCSELIIVV